jgi:hypothetical protein
MQELDAKLKHMVRVQLRLCARYEVYTVRPFAISDPGFWSLGMHYAVDEVMRLPGAKMHGREAA